MTVKRKYSRRDQKVLLSVWHALIGEITLKMRAIYVDWDDRTIYLYFFLDGEFTEEEKEDIRCIESEVISQLPDDDYELHCTRLDFPQSIVCPGQCIYRRKEP